MMTVLLPVNVYMSLSLLLHVSNIYTEEEADLENCLFLNIFFLPIMSILTMVSFGSLWLYRPNDPFLQ